MLKIIKIAAFCLIMSYFIMKVDESNELQGKNKDKKLTAIMVIVLSFYCGLRTWYNDTVTYKQIYERTPLLSGIVGNEATDLAHGLGFDYLNSFIKTIGFSEQDFFVFYSFLTYFLYIWFIRKVSDNLSLSLFLFFTNSWFIFSIASIKQSVAMGFCLVALTFAFDSKWLKFFAFVIIAILFHPYALIYFIVPLMTFKPWTWKSYLYIAGFVVVGLTLGSLIGTILDITELIGADYAEDEFSGAGVNIFRVLVSLAPTAVGFLFRDSLFEKSTKKENLIFNISMLNGLFMFVGIFGTANYFARLANYFLPLQTISLPWMIKKIKQPNSNIISTIAIIGFFGFSYYENSLLKTFDTAFAQMNFFDYIKSHF